MDLEMKGEVALVFGGARGIGKAIARTFAVEGAGVAVVDRDPIVVDTAAKLSSDAGPSQALGLVADVTDAASVGRSIDAVLAKFGRCDHVVYAVGMGLREVWFPFLESRSD